MKSLTDLLNEYDDVVSQARDLEYRRKEIRRNIIQQAIEQNEGQLLTLDNNAIRNYRKRQ